MEEVVTARGIPNTSKVGLNTIEINFSEQFATHKKPKKRPHPKDREIIKNEIQSRRSRTNSPEREKINNPPNIKKELNI